ncbi:alpha/beta hydrolase family protein [Algoriphagus limi]|uniref:Alpha/beta hydrolase family protein n=1 Tax=Algoriphagus limi TaxID=2975273 RepID=A0ABT2G4H9_9BACT|nr:alpha/beta fold hydrolase [Algoriphagus limi]MCS5490186.1 hypothetical protein [Algoriphagus limi]
MSAKSTFKNKAFSISGALVLLVFSLSIMAFKSAKIPAPTGDYSVGSVELELQDANRGGRKLKVILFYPAAEIHQEIIPYHPYPDSLEKDLNSLYGIPKILIKKLSRSSIPSKNLAQAQEIAEGFPLLLFSHGYNGSRFQNSFLLPDLASHGYVVVSIEHTGSAAGTVFEDLRTGGLTPFDSVTHKEPYSDREILKWSDDQIFVLDQLSEMVSAQQMPVELSINLKKVGVFGHSFGGATSANSMIRDKRFLAGINLDGFYFGKGHLKGFNQPFMEIRADNPAAETMSEKDLEEWKMTREEYHDFLFIEWKSRLRGLARGGYESYIIRRSNHMSFSDFSLMFPLGFLTAPNREKHHEVTRQLVRYFFDFHLKGEEKKQVDSKLKSLVLTQSE